MIGTDDVTTDFLSLNSMHWNAKLSHIKKRERDMFATKITKSGPVC